MMPSAHQRIQVTVDRQLADALARVAPDGRSRSRVVRDLALKGAEALDAERRAADEAAAVLLGIARGEIDYDFEGLADLYAARGEHLP